MSWIKKNINLFLSIALLTATIAVFGPFELYVTNYEEFWFDWKDVGVVICILTSCCFLLFLILGMLLKDKGRDLYSCILFLVSIALYVQGNYVNINYGVLDGREIDWGSYTFYAVFDTFIWFFVVGAGVFLWISRRKLLHKIQKYASLFIMALEFVAVAILFITSDIAVQKKSDYYLSDEGIFEVSAKDNIIIFVLDAFDDVYFQEIINQEYNKYSDIFTDFIHFNNASAGGARTKIGMPAIITGEHYPGGLSYVEYIEKSFDGDGLYTVLQKQNYDVRFYTEPVFIPDHSSNLVDNQVSTGYMVSSYSDLTEKYFFLVLYKYMPHVLKKFFWIYSGDFERYKEGNSVKEYKIDDAAYYALMKKSGLQINYEKNIFRLFHLTGAHPPYIINEYAEPVDLDDTSRLNQAKGALHIVEEYISQLKTLGVFDSSTIIIMADHGDQNPAHGILLAKNKERREVFKESRAPVSYYDLHSTIFSELNMKSDVTFFNIEEDESRKRYFYQNSADSGKVRVVEYIIEGDINIDPIKETGIVLEQLLELNKQYEYGTFLTFGGNNTAAKYVVKGLSSADEGIYSWTDGKECEFEFEFKTRPKKLLLSMDILNICYAASDSQRVIIYANDVECYREIISEGKQIQFEIPDTVFTDDRTLMLRMVLPDAAIPAELDNKGNDPRMLSLAISGLQIDEVTE